MMGCDEVCCRASYHSGWLADAVQLQTLGGSQVVGHERRACHGQEHNGSGYRRGDRRHSEPGMKLNARVLEVVLIFFGKINPRGGAFEVEADSSLGIGAADIACTGL